jgi:DNA ligase (NAD+)
MKLRPLEEEILQLVRWEKAYYEGIPLISDAEYDSVRDRIVERIKKENPGHSYLASVGAKVSDGGNWPKFKHTEVMGSLFKVNSYEEFMKWAKPKGNKFFLAEKADGWTLAAYFKQGKLQTLATRGDGEIGDDVTPNAKFFTNVKLNLSLPFTGIIRGEGIIHLDDFDKHFAPSGASNPRNAAGKIRDTKNDGLKKFITVKWFDIIGDQNFNTWGEKFDYLQKLGLETIPYVDNLSAEQTWERYLDYSSAKRSKLNYWIDGLVIRIADLKNHDALGIVDRRPKGSIAIKFPSIGVQTTLIAVEINRGLAGRLTPVGIINPVIIDGTTVTRVSMHGLDWIEAMGLAIGDTVEVAKKGDIIPQITQKIADGTKRTPIIFPTHCPLCNDVLVRNGAYIECQNKTTCAGETYGAIAKWLQKVDIKGIGDSILLELIKEVKDIDQLYEADATAFVRATGGSQKTGKKIWKELHSKKEISLAVFLSALHVASLGSTNGQRLAAHFKTLDGVMAATEDDLRKIPGISENASKMIEGLKRKAKTIDKLRKLLDIQEIKQGIFTGQSFCITGKCSKPRNEIEDWIKSLGGVVKGVDKGLTYLVTDDATSGSAKNQKADKYGVKKISEQDLYALGKTDTATTAASSEEPTHKVQVKLGRAASLFESIVSNDVAWIELQKVSVKKYKIINCSFKDPTQRIGYIDWDDEVEDLDGGSTPQSKAKGISSHLQWNDVSLTEESVVGTSIQDIEKALDHTNLTVWEEAEL